MSNTVEPVFILKSEHRKEAICVSFISLWGLQCPLGVIRNTAEAGKLYTTFYVQNCHHNVKPKVLCTSCYDSLNWVSHIRYPSELQLLVECHETDTNHQLQYSVCDLDCSKLQNHLPLPNHLKPLLLQNQKIKE